MRQAAPVQKDFDSLILDGHIGQSEHPTTDVCTTLAFIFSDGGDPAYDAVSVSNRMADDVNCAMIDGDVLSPKDYEPMRFCGTTAPPKRFYRSFWTSVARRMLENDETTMVK